MYSKYFGHFWVKTKVMFSHMQLNNFVCFLSGVKAYRTIIEVEIKKHAQAENNSEERLPRGAPICALTVYTVGAFSLLLFSAIPIFLLLIELIVSSVSGRPKISTRFLYGNHIINR